MDPETLSNAMNLISQGMSCKAAASKLGIPNATLARWINRAAKHGGDIEAATAPRATGRPVAFPANDFEILLARWYRLSKESVDAAAYFFARDNRVREEVRDVIDQIWEKSLRAGKRPEWPESVRKAFRVTPQEKAAFRNRKLSEQEEMVTRRGMFEVLEDGTIRDILPGDTWEMDDYSTNQPYLYKCPTLGEILLGRQILAARDLCSAKWLGFDHIGRPRDAYRGEDIPRTIERLIRAWGMPKRLRLERGSWESSFIHGIVVEGTEFRWGDLRDLMEIEHVFKSKGKGLIEGGFNMLQRFLAHTGTDIGRVRGEFEEAAKRLRQAQSSKIDPLTLGFITQEHSSRLHEEAAALINSRPMRREHLDERVSPDDLSARLGWHTRQLSESDAWYFRPYKIQRTVSAGTVSTSHKESGWPKMTFTLNGIREGVHFESGHQVLIAYDPARPDLGAYVCNADQSARNRQGWKMGQMLIPNAPDFGLAPQFSAAAVLSPHLIARKKASAAAATTFRAIRAAAGAPQPGGSREAMAMNGSGGTASAGDIVRPEPAPAAPAAEIGPVPQSIRPSREIIPAISSRPSRDAAAEIRQLQAELEEA